MQFNKKDIISIEDFSKDEILHVISTSLKMESFPKLLNGEILASLFFEPSTRTRLSFEAAMHRLGGNVIGFSDISKTSLAKGESFEDTIKVVDGYSDVIVVRHPKEGFAKIAADIANKPVINAGDGSNQHPTQTFLDLFTIFKSKGDIENLNIGFLGDLKFGRTVHSLALALSNFNVNMFFISPNKLKMPKDILNKLEGKINFMETADIYEVSNKLDVVYATRIQQERFQVDEDFQLVKGSYNLDLEFLKKAKNDVIIMHPLPRVGEIKHELDATKNAVYFKQAYYGLPVRMALLSLVLGKI